MPHSKLPSKKTMYAALMDKDRAFEDVFFAGVTTTGIFCRPTCTTRKPKKENVEYFSSTKNALSYGYRSCRVCLPMLIYGKTPVWLKDLLKDINSNQSLKVKDTDLRRKGIDPSRLRRWFKKHHRITFQDYLRLSRINKMFNHFNYNIKTANSVFQQEYDTSSEFTDTFKKTTGLVAAKSNKNSIVYITKILTSLGPMLAGATDEGVCLLEFTDRRMLETQIRRLKKLLKAKFFPTTNKHLINLNKQLKEYFDGKRKLFNISLVLPCSAFQLNVWKSLQLIPYGQTRSYSEIAVTVGNPKAVRAVARANGDNRISILIPCHRVISKNGELAGYGGGLWRKKYLLNLEKKHN